MFDEQPGPPISIRKFGELHGLNRDEAKNLADGFEVVFKIGLAKQAGPDGHPHRVISAAQRHYFEIAVLYMRAEELSAKMAMQLTHSARLKHALLLMQQLAAAAPTYSQLTTAFAKTVAMAEKADQWVNKAASREIDAAVSAAKREQAWTAELGRWAAELGRARRTWAYGLMVTGFVFLFCVLLGWQGRDLTHRLSDLQLQASQQAAVLTKVNDRLVQLQCQLTPRQCPLKPRRKR
jgi:hypothetical protein